MVRTRKTADYLPFLFVTRTSVVKATNSYSQNEQKQLRINKKIVIQKQLMQK